MQSFKIISVRNKWIFKGLRKTSPYLVCNHYNEYACADSISPGKFYPTESLKDGEKGSKKQKREKGKGIAEHGICDIIAPEKNCCPIKERSRNYWPDSRFLFPQNPGPEATVDEQRHNEDPFDRVHGDQVVKIWEQEVRIHGAREGPEIMKSNG